MQKVYFDEPFFGPDGNLYEVGVRVTPDTWIEAGKKPKKGEISLPRAATIVDPDTPVSDEIITEPEQMAMSELAPLTAEEARKLRARLEASEKALEEKTDAE